ncbi:MAG: ABC transporter substrate-binding protein [Planctomycetota bacterium]|nr:ABC transporter substrate-binding protein [Planctomycetota bacterium]
MRCLALLVLLSFTAHDVHAEDGPTKRAALRLAATAPLATLDPAKASSDLERVVVSNLFDQLYTHDHDARPFRLQPVLAAGMPEMSPDGLVHTIRLRPDMRYLDDRCFPDGKGRAVTAHDVRFCLLRLMDSTVKSPGQWILARRVKGLDAFVTASANLPENPTRDAYRSTEGYPEVEGIEVVDDLTLRIHLLRPMPELPWLLASPWLSIYAPEGVRVYGKDLGLRAIGTGPFRVTLFQRDKSLLLRRRPEYTSPLGADLPRVETVELAVFQDPLQVWAALMRKEADYAEVPRDVLTEIVQPATGQLIPHLADLGVTLERNPRLEVQYDAFRWSDPVVGGKAGEKGRAIRYAICLASDEDYALKRLYTHQAERVYGPILPELSAYDPTLSNESMRGEDESEADALDIARQMLADVGYGPKKPVPTIRMHILSDPTSRVVFDLLKQQVARVGITLEAVTVTWPELQEATKRGEAQMWSSAWHADIPDAQDFMQLFYGPNVPEPNYSGYRNREADRLYAAARALPPGEERDDLLNDMEVLVVRDCAWRYRFRRIQWTALYPWVQGYRFNGIAPKDWRHVAIAGAARAAAAR